MNCCIGMIAFLETDSDVGENDALARCRLTQGKANELRGEGA
jgi:hypothetical protein